MPFHAFVTCANSTNPLTDSRNVKGRLTADADDAVTVNITHTTAKTP